MLLVFLFRPFHFVLTPTRQNMAVEWLNAVACIKTVP
jgi:hypothetical protein